MRERGGGDGRTVESCEELRRSFLHRRLFSVASVVAAAQATQVGPGAFFPVRVFDPLERAEEVDLFRARRLRGIVLVVRTRGGVEVHPGEDDHRAVLPLGPAAVAVAVAAGHARELTRGALDHPRHLPRERGEPAGALGVGAGDGVEISVSVFGRGAQVGTLVVGVGVVELDGLVVRAHHRGDDVGGTRVELVPSQRRQLIVRPGRRLGERRHPRVEPLRGQRGVVESEGPSRGRGALPRQVRQDPAQHQPDLRPLLGGARAEVHQERHAPHAVRHRRASDTGSNFAPKFFLTWMCQQKS